MPLSPSNWLTWLGVILLTIIRFFPRIVRLAIANALATLIVKRNSAQARAININLQACFPELDAVQRLDFYKRYMSLQIQSLMLLPRLWWASDQTIISTSELHNRAVMDAAVERNEPIVLLATHSVALDAGLLAVGPHYPLQGIYKPLKNPVVDWLVRRSRQRFGATPRSRGDGLRQIIRELSERISLVYLSDEDLGAKGSVFAPFFGRQKATLNMLPRIVAKTGATVIPMVAHLDPASDTIHVHFFEPLQSYPSGDNGLDAEKMNEAIRDTIMLQPEQFLWKLRIFRSCPNGNGTRYGQIERGELSIDDL